MQGVPDEHRAPLRALRAPARDRSPPRGALRAGPWGRRDRAPPGSLGEPGPRPPERSSGLDNLDDEDVEIDAQTYQWIHLHGDDAEEGLAQLGLEAGTEFLSVRQVKDTWVIRRPRFHPTGFDWIVAANHVDEVTGKLNATADVANDSDRELGRILLGLPKVGAEIGDRTLPPEVGFADAVAYDKGCYAGQEVLARIRTYGHVNREIRRIDFNAEGRAEQQPQVGDDVWPHPNGEKPVAKITSITKNGESWAAIVSVRYRYLSEAAEDELLVWNPDGEVKLTGTLQQVFTPKN